VPKEAVVVHLAGQHAESLKASLVKGTVQIRLALRHTDALCTGHAVWAVRRGVAGRRDPHTLNVRVTGEVLRT